MPNFNRVVIKNTTEPIGTKHYDSFYDERPPFVYDGGNVHIALHPFKCPRLVSMNRPQDYGLHFDDYEMPEYQKRLADALWESLPALHTLFFGNGQITIQHRNVFSDDEIFEAAEQIIRPILEQNQMLNTLDINID